MLTRARAKREGRGGESEKDLKQSPPAKKKRVKSPTRGRGRGRGRGQGLKRKAVKEPEMETPTKTNSTPLQIPTTISDGRSEKIPEETPNVKSNAQAEGTCQGESESKAKKKVKAASDAAVFSAAIRPRKKEEGTFYLRDLRIVCTDSEMNKPHHCVECVNYHKEDIFGHDGENLNKGFNGFCCIYLVPIWTNQKELANITGFELMVSPVEDTTRQNLYVGVPGMFVYLVPTFNPEIQDRIIGLQLYRSRKYNPPHFGWSNTTININEGRGGDHLCLQWDLGNEQDIPGHKFRFRFWRR